jgi:uncharacterized protein (DUF58 family)
MTSAELARAVRHIEITSRKAVTASFAGEYRSAFKGRGIEFDEVRDYVPGDDVRTIDWKVTARMGHLHTRRYIEERELTVILMVDLSASGSFGSGERTKSEIAAEVAAILAFSAIANSDHVGLLAFTDRVETYVPPRKGSTHVLRIVRDILSFRPTGTGTGIRSALESLAALVKRRAVVFLVSDFIDEGFERQMKAAARQHDLIAVSVTDPRETELPAVGLVSFRDAESGQMVLVDTASPGVRAAYRAAQSSRRETLAAYLTSSGIGHIPLTVGADHVAPLSRFFLARERRS